MHPRHGRKSLARLRRTRTASFTAAVVAVALFTLVAAAVDHDRTATRTVAQQRIVSSPAAASIAAAPTAATVAAAPRTVFVVGDSLTVGTQPWLAAALQRRGWRLTGVDARVGRPVAEGLRVLRLRHHLPPTVVIALGTNDLGATTREVASWLSAARHILGGRRIVWVNLCLDDTRQPRLHGFRLLNAALVRFGPRAGVQIADWCTYAGRHGITPGGDGIHYGPSGYQRRAAFYALALAARSAAALSVAEARLLRR